MWTSPNIIVIDDDKVIREGFELWLKRELPEANVKSCECFKEELFEGHCDVVLLDYYLRGIEAPEIIKKIREIDEDVLIIVMSGAFIVKNGKFTCINRQLYQSALDSGANRILPKNIPETIDVVKTHLKVRYEDLQTDLA